MVTKYNKKLYRAIGMPFTYKQFLQEFLTDLSTNALVLNVISDPDDQAQLVSLKDDFILCGPSMGFSAKQYAYEFLEKIVQGLIDGASLTSEEDAKLNKYLLEVLRYVGIEGEGDFNFQNAIFRLAETISAVTGETVQIVDSVVGTVASLLVFDGIGGFTPSTPLSVIFDSSETSDDSTSGTLDLDVDGDGNVVNGEYISPKITDARDGFYVGQIVVLYESGTPEDIVALAEVTAIG